MTPATRLPSWRAGATRDAVMSFLEASRSVPVADRVAYFDNDGTLWCERPAYIQLEFFVDALRRRVADDPQVGDRAEYAAVLANDDARIGTLGLERVALALAELFAGLTPETFAAHVREFMRAATHSELARPLMAVVYQPMSELLDELRALDFTIAIVTGGGTEFVRAVSEELYGVPPELVVGTLIAYDLERDANEHLTLRRTNRIAGGANEGPAKVTNIQTQLGRRPLLAAGNSAGDREMLEWACASDRPHLALLVDHDDNDREYRYTSAAATATDTEPIVELAQKLGWTTVSMRSDWATVFPDTPPD